VTVGATADCKPARREILRADSATPSGLRVRCAVRSVDRYLRGRTLIVIAWFVGWSNQGEVGVFRRNCSRTGRSEKSVRELLAAVGLREPPRGGIDQGQALDRGQVRLTLAEDCHGGPNVAGWG
jgi:hypothetical protein